MSRFDDAIAVRREGPGTFVAELDAAYGIEGNTNGGYLMAIMARAGMDATGTTHPHTLSASFLRPGVAGPARVDVQILRSGRTATYARAVLSQHGEIAVDAALVLGAAPPFGRAAPAPFPMPPSEEYCERAVPKTHVQGLLDRIAVSYDQGLGPHDPVGPGQAALIRGWIRPLDDAAPDALAVLLASDCLPPSIFRLGYGSWAPTVQLTVHVHRVPAPGPLAAQSVAGEIRDGWFDEETTVADSTGGLVARARQLARAPRRITP